MDKVFVTEIIRGRRYFRLEQLADYYGVSRGTVRSRIREIEGLSGPGKRYSDKAIIGEGRGRQVNELVYLDYEKYRKRLKSPQLSKYVPPYDPAEWARELGEHTIRIQEVKEAAV